MALLEETVKENNLQDDIVLSGSFCTGECNRVGVTVTVNDTVHTGITPVGFSAFWKDVIMNAVENERK